MSTSLPGQPIGKEESGFYEPYAALARNLRTWFIAYGIGGPVIFLTNEPAAKALYSAGVGRSVAYCFLGGDRKSTRLNSSHLVISYAVFCLKKKKDKNCANVV